jgi:hypothetical protein
VFWQRELDDYDLVLFADIGHSAEVLLRCWHQLGPAVASRKLVVVDGYDIPQPFPYFNQRQHLWRYPWYFRLPLRRIKYFKREGVKASPHIQPISMSIPESFIEQVKPAAKKKDWVAYNVDPELNSLFETHQLAPLGQRHFVFGDASSYYHELLASRFGITSRRAGWDCLRHYEYAAKGVVLCFKDLDKKPESAAPHGLDKTNCIIYHHEADLKSQLAAMTTERYAQLQQGGYKWIRQFTTKAVALRFLQMAFPGEHND